jgi:hypothetical protein
LAEAAAERVRLITTPSQEGRSSGRLFVRTDSVKIVGVEIDVDAAQVLDASSEYFRMSPSVHKGDMASSLP